jgi:hypothetical protein
MQNSATVVTKAKSHHRWNRVWEPRPVGVERCTLVMQNLVTRVTKAKSHRRWGRVWERGSGGGCRKMQLGDANLGDKGDEGNEPSSLEPRVGAVVGVERCTLGIGNAKLGDKW